ncbi:isoflavone reductase [Fusarium pseudocircinatum]|uniref:Isoflavone reductase n=1 Tax=Fusarium pseudocircinatum TaxID=56676 RepID=A0A8H5PUN3_9HYPO|nr:isoflavone reductase [Fusarium pseudocircinatum]
MSKINTVAIIGGSGNVGAHVTKELVAAGFSVTVLTRQPSTVAFPPGAIVRRIDFDSPERLTKVFSGQDAVVSLIAPGGIGEQKKVIDAAIDAGVKRFLPSEFGVNTRTATGAISKALAAKIGVTEYLITKSKENPSFTWTGLSTGVFFDWVITKEIAGISIRNKSATIFDSGNELFQTTQLSTVAKAVSVILRHPGKTANTYLSVASFNVSQNGLVSLVGDLLGTSLALTHVKSHQVQEEGEKRLATGDPSCFIKLLQAYNFADGAGHALKLEESANHLLELPEEDIRAVLKDLLSRFQE